MTDETLAGRDLSVSEYDAVFEFSIACSNRNRVEEGDFLSYKHNPRPWGRVVSKNCLILPIKNIPLEVATQLLEPLYSDGKTQADIDALTELIDDEMHKLWEAYAVEKEFDGEMVGFIPPERQEDYKKEAQELLAQYPMPSVLKKRRYKIPFDKLKIFYPTIDLQMLRDEKVKYQPFKIYELAVDWNTLKKYVYDKSKSAIANFLTTAIK